MTPLSINQTEQSTSASAQSSRSRWKNCLHQHANPLFVTENASAAATCRLPVMTPMHCQPPMNTVLRQIHDIHEAEELAKLALELNAPTDMTLQSTFERLVALAGSKEFLPIAAKVRHYLHSVAHKRREWCVEFCTRPYNIGYYHGSRDGMVCGNTYIVPAATLEGIDPDHILIMQQIAAMQQDVPPTPCCPNLPLPENLPQNTNTATTSSASATINNSNESQQAPRALRPCCSVDTAVFDALGVSGIPFDQQPQNDYYYHEYTATPPWLNSIHSIHAAAVTAAYRVRCEHNDARAREIAAQMFQVQILQQQQHQRTALMQMQMDLQMQAVEMDQQHVLPGMYPPVDDSDPEDFDACSSSDEGGGGIGGETGVGKFGFTNVDMAMMDAGFLDDLQQFCQENRQLSSAATVRSGGGSGNSESANVTLHNGNNANKQVHLEEEDGEGNDRLRNYGNSNEDVEMGDASSSNELNGYSSVNIFDSRGARNSEVATARAAGAAGAAAAAAATVDVVDVDFDYGSSTNCIVSLNEVAVGNEIERRSAAARAAEI
ncbi:hypothetical protein HK100_004166 [Physocladia obscura]|uniref:Uncharacterized protein n=1 Tax=Physocladia obscura TaxID=109957 RepID=A0AAD5XA19_9FUNG|nr:hypothetical protein HK100_004166 [Physocladia obscura]